jgi:uncharacterized protein (DUF885 family)
MGVRMHTTTNMTPQQVHELGLAEVARVSAEMDAILKAQGLSDGTIGARVQQLARSPEQQYPNTPEGKKAMLAQYQAILDEVNKGLGSAFDLRPQLGVKVEQVPPSSEATAPGAYYMMGRFDGSRPGVFYANMRNPGDTPKFAMRTLAYHEGIRATTSRCDRAGDAGRAVLPPRAAVHRVSGRLGVVCGAAGV